MNLDTAITVITDDYRAVEGAHFGTRRAVECVRAHRPEWIPELRLGPVVEQAFRVVVEASADEITAALDRRTP